MTMDPAQISGLAEQVASLYADTDAYLVGLIAQYTSAGIDTPKWVTDQQARAAKFSGVAAQLLANLAPQTAASIQEAVMAAADIGDNAAQADLAARVHDPSIRSGRRIDPAAIHALAAEATGIVTGTHPAILRSANDTYRRVITEVTGRALTGAVAPRQALQQALDRFAAEGISGFTDSRGRRWHMDTYAEMAVRTAAARALNAGHTARLISAGHDLVVVSAHPRPAPECRRFENRLVSLTGKTPNGPVTVKVGKKTVTETVVASMAEAEAEGLHHHNCRHRHSLWRPGKPLPDPPADDAQGYRDEQTLRRLERSARAQRRKLAAAVTPAAKQAATDRLAAIEDRIGAHVKATGVPRRRYREQLREGNAANAITPVKVEAPKPEPEPVVETVPELPPLLAAREFGDADNILHTKTDGAAGSNDGGFYTGADGVKRYVKFYTDEAQAYGEHLANTLYRDLGIDAPVSQLFRTADGRIAYASEIIPDTVTLAKAGLTEDRARQVMDGFAADIVTGNWDAVGTGLDNVVITPDGRAIRIDNGGVLLMRAQAGRKPVALLNQITEWERFLDGSNPYYRQVAKAAGVSKAEDLGVGLAEQIHAIRALRDRAGGWDAYVDTHAAGLNAADRAQMVAMLNARTELLEQKLADLPEPPAKPVETAAKAAKPKPPEPAEMTEAQLAKAIAAAEKKVAGFKKPNSLLAMPAHAQLAVLRHELRRRDPEADHTPTELEARAAALVAQLGAKSPEAKIALSEAKIAFREQLFADQAAFADWLTAEAQHQTDVADWLAAEAQYQTDVTEWLAAAAKYSADVDAWLVAESDHNTTVWLAAEAKWHADVAAWIKAEKKHTAAVKKWLKAEAAHNKAAAAAAAATPAPAAGGSAAAAAASAASATTPAGFDAALGKLITAKKVKDWGTYSPLKAEWAAKLGVSGDDLNKAINDIAFGDADLDIVKAALAAAKGGPSGSYTPLSAPPAPASSPSVTPSPSTASAHVDVGSDPDVAPDPNAPVGSAQNPRHFPVPAGYMRGVNEHLWDPARDYCAPWNENDPNALAPVDRGAIEFYTDDGFRDINRSLRESDGKKSLPGKGEDLDKFYEHGVTGPNEWVILTRGTGPEYIGLKPGEDPFKAIGKTVASHAYTSTSIGDEPAFPGELRVIIRTPPGTKCCYMDGKPGQGRKDRLTRYPDEREVLLAKSTYIKVISVTKRKPPPGKWKYDVVCEIVKQDA